MNTYDIYYNSTNLHEETFIDRTEIRNILEKYYSLFNIDGTNMFKVFYIYGFGGMGKTCLIKYLKKEFLSTIPSNLIIHISFEIQENNQILYSLIKIRKAFNHPCPVFDYAILYYWNLERIERLNDEFVKLLKGDIFSAYTDVGITIASSLFEFIALSFGDVQNIINDLHMKIQNLRIKTAIHEILQMDSNEICENLPLFLARDIKDYMHKNAINYIFLIDSFQQSIPYSESEEWLLSFISELQRGLFIITGREKILWKVHSYKIEKLHLDIYPEKEARDFLGRIIPDSRYDILDTIISTSGCIPIYVSLAFDLYKQEQDISTDDLIKKSKFNDRKSLVRHFINHLNPNWQEIIIYLAVVKIFNNDIFEYLIDDLNLSCSKLDFEEIVNVSLFKYIENSNGLYKLHNVISSNAVYILKPNVINKIFNSYLVYISKRSIYKNLINNDLESIITLFKNIIDICIDNSYSINYSKKILENIIDLFLVISDTRAAFPIPKPSLSYASEINDVLYFMNAIADEKVNTNDTLYKLKQVKNPSLFGKHVISYNIVLKYQESLIGNYMPFKDYLENVKRTFTEFDQTEWFYLKTFIYLADYYMMEGDFVKAYGYLENLRDALSLDIYHTDNYFLLERSIGHIYRFNYDFEKASEKYKNLLERYNDSPSLKVYLLVNLCETKCYIHPHYVIEHFSEAMRYVEQFQNLKNKAKLYYSRGIAYILLRKYTLAMEDINMSIQINQKDGYSSGKLFAYQAKAFCEYGENGSISNQTMKDINKLIQELNVYKFLLYPLCLIQGNMQKMDKIKWIDSEITEKNCKEFIKRLRPRKNSVHPESVC